MSTAGGKKPDARRSPRFLLEQVVAVSSIDGRFPDLSGVSRDVSAAGIFFYVDESLPVGGGVELFMMMPQKDPFAEALFPLRCFGAVVRVVRHNSRYGVAVAFEKIDVIAEGRY
jgi:PilZ domain-containing protein